MPAAPPATKELLSFLRSPESYPHAPEEVEIVQTHISLVALAGPFVYKVKKAVDFGFLDFTTLEQRHRYCREEIRLNRRLCSSIYLGVLPITQEGDQLAFEGSGPVVEYAVKMRRLPPEGFLHQKVQAGTATQTDLDRVADHLLPFYRAQFPSPETAAWGRAELLRYNTDENLNQTEAHVGTHLSSPAFEALRYYIERFYEQYAALLNRRRAGGCIVDGHGDLRLEHVHLSEDRVCIYDCIEFSERLRSVDIVNDLAFLAMDLDVHGRPDLSSYFLSRMAEDLDTPFPPPLVNFYKCYRAYVRGKVEGLQGENEEESPDEHDQHRKRARAHYQWALRYAVAGSRPLVVVVMGPPATGKSTQARALAEALGWRVASSDRIRKQRAGVPLHERGDEATRRELYSRARTKETYDTLAQEALRSAEEDRGIVLDATYSRLAYRETLRERLRQADIPHAFVELTADPEVLKNRLRNRASETTISDARLEDFDQLTARYDPPDALEDARHVLVSSEKEDEQATTLAILKHLIRLQDG